MPKKMTEKNNNRSIDPIDISGEEAAFYNMDSFAQGIFCQVAKMKDLFFLL